MNFKRFKPYIKEGVFAASAYLILISFTRYDGLSVFNNIGRSLVESVLFGAFIGFFLVEVKKRKK